MAVYKILVVDDDPDMREMMIQFLRNNGLMALAAATEIEILNHLKDSRIDLILLDVMLGDENGIEICHRLRTQQNVPIIFVSALSADHQRMAGYQVGADDYIAKPFNPDLLLARLQAVLSRTHRSSSLAYRRRIKRFYFGDWIYDGKLNEIRAPSGYLVSLSRRETSLLKVFLANPHIPLTRDEIEEALNIIGTEERAESSGRSIDMLVKRLRSKIEIDPKSPEMIRTERGLGYIFAVDVEAKDD